MNNHLLFVRNSLGIGQEALAQLLDVHLSTLKMAERGRRTLPAEAQNRLVWMLEFLETQGGVGIEEPFTTETVEDFLRKIRSKKRKVDKEAEKLHTQHRQMKQRLAFEAVFLTQYPAEVYASEASRISALSMEARTFFTFRDEEARLEVFVRQAGLAAMIAWLEKKI